MQPAHFAHEVESRPLNNLRGAIQRVCSEEDRGTKQALEGLHKSAVLLSSGLHAERFQHLGCSSEPNHLAALLDG